ncbi:unnamed protein product, partial [Prorocentrum cordatum]
MPRLRGRHTVLLRSDGIAVACEDKGFGQCDLRALVAGMTYTQVAAVLLRSDGTAVACGDAGLGQCNLPALVVNLVYTQVAAGVSHTILLGNGGAAAARGGDSHGQCELPSLAADLSYTAHLLPALLLQASRAGDPVRFATLGGAERHGAGDRGSPPRLVDIHDQPSADSRAGRLGPGAWRVDAALPAGPAAQRLAPARPREPACASSSGPVCAPGAIHMERKCDTISRKHNEVQTRVWESYLSTLYEECMLKAKVMNYTSIACSTIIIVLNVLVVGATDLNIGSLAVAIFMVIVSVVKALQLKFLYDNVAMECHDAKAVAMFAEIVTAGLYDLVLYGAGMLGSRASELGQGGLPVKGPTPRMILSALRLRSDCAAAVPWRLALTAGPRRGLLFSFACSQHSRQTRRPCGEGVGARPRSSGPSATPWHPVGGALLLVPCGVLTVEGSRSCLGCPVGSAVLCLWQAALRDQLLKVRELRNQGDHDNGVSNADFDRVRKGVLEAIQATPAYISLDHISVLNRRGRRVSTQDEQAACAGEPLPRRGGAWDAEAQPPPARPQQPEAAHLAQDEGEAAHPALDEGGAGERAAEQGEARGASASFSGARRHGALPGADRAPARSADVGLEAPTLQVQWAVRAGLPEPPLRALPGLGTRGVRGIEDIRHLCAANE